MGIKRLREHFKIEHIVQQCDGYIAIGSPYIHDLLKIMQPSLELRWGNLGPSKNDNLARYHKEMYESWKVGELDQIISSPDDLSATIPVYTHESGKVIKKECEEFGWPNTTTDGELMYENTFYKTRGQALKSCREEAVYSIKAVKYPWQNLIREIKQLTIKIARGIRDFTRSFVFFGL